MWEIFTYGGGNYLPEVFTGLKMFFSSGEFTSLARLAGTVSILIISSTALTLKSYNPTEWLNYLVRYALVYTALFVPTTTVSIVDRLNPNVSSPQVISDVPWGVGAFAGITSTLGDGLARLYDQFITIPGDQKYEKYGMLFGSTLVVNTFDTRFPDADFAQNMNQFVQNCALPMLARNVITMSQLDVADSVWDTFKNAAPANRFVVYRENGTEDTIACGGPDSAASKLDILMPTQTDSGINTLSGGMFPGMDRAQATAIVGASIGSSMQDLANISKSSSETIKQAMMINAVRDAMANPPSGTDTASMAVAYAQASAEATQHMNYRVAGAIAAENIPLLRTVIECLLYALFPVAGIMMLLPFGITALGYYLKSLVWINLWPLLYAILNSVMYWYAQAQTSSAAILPDGSTAYTIYNAMNLYSVNTKVTDYAGYMVASIPVLAYYMIQGGSAAGASMVQTIMQPAMSAAASEGSAIAKGNINQGNMSADNISHHNTGSWKYDTNGRFLSGKHDRQNSSGTIISRSADGTGAANDSGMQTSVAGITSKLSEKASKDFKAQHDLHYMEGVDDVVAKGATLTAGDKYSRGLAEAAKKTQEMVNAYNREHAHTKDVTHGATVGLGLKVPELVTKTIGVTGGVGYEGKTTDSDKNSADARARAAIAKQVETTMKAAHEYALNNQGELSKKITSTESEGERATFTEALATGRASETGLDLRSWVYNSATPEEKAILENSVANPFLAQKVFDKIAGDNLNRFVSAADGKQEIFSAFQDYKGKVETPTMPNGPNALRYRGDAAREDVQKRVLDTDEIFVGVDKKGAGVDAARGALTEHTTGAVKEHKGDVTSRLNSPFKNP